MNDVECGKIAKKCARLRKTKSQGLLEKKLVAFFFWRMKNAERYYCFGTATA